MSEWNWCLGCMTVFLGDLPYCPECVEQERPGLSVTAQWQLKYVERAFEKIKDDLIRDAKAKAPTNRRRVQRKGA